MSLKYRTIVKKTALNPLAQLIIAILLSSCCYSLLSTNIIRVFLTISSCLRELLVFVLPFLLFSFTAVSLSKIPKESMLFILALMAIVFVSNFTNILISGVVGFSLLSKSTSREIHEGTILFAPFFSLSLPSVANTAPALILGVIVGFVNSFRRNEYVDYVIHTIHDYVMKFMKSFFVPLLPLFVSGFLLKLFAEGKMTGFVCKNYHTCTMMCGFLFCYLTLWLLIAASFNKNRAIEILKNIFPAIVTAFSTMSSAAALPLSLEAAEKNTKDRVLSNVVMPLTLNFHMVGDTIVVPIMAMIVLLAFNHPLPSVYNFVIFGTFFVLNKFAGGGVPSGTIMVTVPVLTDYLGFDNSMTAFIIAFYGVIDPIVTSGNVTANNLFVIMLQKILLFGKKHRMTALTKQ